MSEPSIVPARAEAQLADGVMTVTVGGEWKLTGRRPDWRDLAAQTMQAHPGVAAPHTIRVVGDGLVDWDSALPLFVRHARTGAESIGAKFETENLPAGAVQLMDLLVRREAVHAEAKLPDLFTAVGVFTHHLAGEARDLSRLVGECVFSFGRFVRGQAQFRWRDCLLEMQQCGAQALPIVGLISFLVGIILAYQGAVQLRQFGADIYVADMVGVAVVREMGPLMAAIVLAGRTGAAFAATLGNMKANEEIDALDTLGVSPIDFLVMPRLVALLAMMPLLALYSNVLGIFGGLVISRAILDIPASLYWAETKTIVDLSDLFTGLIKAGVFGLLVGVSGCLRGLQAERSAAGVGRAATAAVVTGILLIIVSDTVFAVIFNILGW
ncbi:MAG: ABC transporter permease [Candidatus Didemnitutus sp.]|jgi:phospholipid/cholesterol/gamma-HCH transport system permease protein|nr:ABC transporter permease [Candidatus Didemnitutus sp.]